MVVEVWSDLDYHVWLGERDSSSLLPPRLSSHLNGFCKVGWLGKGYSLREADEIDGRCGFVHSILVNHKETRMRLLSKLKNRSALVILLARGDGIMDAATVVTGDKKRKIK